ncbi:fatty acid-binding protein 5 isoform 4-T5 [Hipposideros larvatus]
MASILQLVGRWRLVDSKGFDEYMKELGVGMALRKMGAMAKPDCVITSDGKHLTVKMESTLKTTQFSCDLGEKFEETTADGRKTQTVCNFVNGALVQHQEWDGKESTITRKLENGKLMVREDWRLTIQGLLKGTMKSACLKGEAVPTLWSASGSDVSLPWMHKDTEILT